MRIFYILFVLFLLTIAGCKKPEQSAQVNKLPEAKIEAPRTKPESPVIPQPLPLLPPSANFLKGYNDGYYGTWLGPIRWFSNSDYRNGWSAGDYDRNNQISHKYGP